MFLGSPSGIMANPVNRVPVADSLSVTVDEDSTNNPIVLTGSDVDGDVLSYVITSHPINGNLGGTVPNLLYTPQAGYNGVDTFKFVVNDGTVNSKEATVTITINAVGDDQDGSGGGGGGCFISLEQPLFLRR